MYGAIIGDIIGSVYELHNVKTEEFPLFTAESRFTDDTVLTVAVAEKLMADRTQNIRGHGRRNYAMWFRQYYGRYPGAGYGQMFSEWAISSNLTVQRSYGNGGAMRVTPIGYAFENIPDLLNEVERSCFYTHHNREAITCAKAVALSVFLARKECDKDEIKKSVEKHTKLNLNFSLDEIRESYVFDSRSRQSVPQAIVAFLESEDYESAIRKAVSIGGDSDTIACMAGGIAEAYYGKIPEEIKMEAARYLDGTLKNVVGRFQQTFQTTIKNPLPHP